MRPSNLARDTMLLLGRGLRVSLRAPVSAFIFPIVFPLLTMIFVSQLTARITSLPIFPYHPYIAYLAPGTLLLVPMIGAGYAATGLVIDANTGFLDRIRLLPTRTSAILLAKLLFEAIRVLPAGIIMLAVSVALGAYAGHGLVTVAGVLALIVLWSMAYSGLFYFVGLRTLSAQAPVALLPLALPVLFSSTALVPPALMPGWLSTVARWNPYSYLVGGARTLMTGNPVDLAAIAKAVAVALAILVITQLLVRSALHRIAKAT
jgi:ABC-2 type transport system permease protein